MKSRELNLILINSLPEIKSAYYDETSWQEGDDTGSHIVFEDVFIPFIKEQINANNTEIINRIFDFIENIIILDDEYGNEVISFSVLEALIFDVEIKIESFIEYVKPKTLGLIEEIIA